MPGIAVLVDRSGEVRAVREALHASDDGGCQRRNSKQSPAKLKSPLPPRKSESCVYGYRESGP
jgi:hypothetical protein